MSHNTKCAACYFRVSFYLAFINEFITMLVCYPKEFVFAVKHPVMVRSGEDNEVYKWTPPMGIGMDAQMYICVENLIEQTTTAKLQKQGGGWSMERLDNISLFHVFRIPMKYLLYVMKELGDISNIYRMAVFCSCFASRLPALPEQVVHSSVTVLPTYLLSQSAGLHPFPSFPIYTLLLAPIPIISYLHTPSLSPLTCIHSHHFRIRCPVPTHVLPPRWATD